MKITNLFRLNWIATTRLNYCAGGWRAVLLMPIKVYGSLQLQLGGRIVLPPHAARCTLVLGEKYEDYTAATGCSQLDLQGTLRLGGIVRIGPDVYIGVRRSGVLTLGDGCCIGRNSQIRCSGLTTMGRDVCAAELYLTDSTEHEMVRDGVPCTMNGEVIVEDGVMLSYRSMVLAGTHVPPGSVVAAGALLNRDYRPDGTENLLLAGVPAQVRATGYTWHKDVYSRT